MNITLGAETFVRVRRPLSGRVIEEIFSRGFILADLGNHPRAGYIMFKDLNPITQGQ